MVKSKQKKVVIQNFEDVTLSAFLNKNYILYIIIVLHFTVGYISLLTGYVCKYREAYNCNAAILCALCDL